MMIHWIRPYWLLGLIPVFYMIWVFIRQEKKTSAWQKICDPHLLDHLLIRSEKISHHWPILLLGIGWILSVLALAGPSLKQLPQDLYQTNHAMVIVLDLSSKMNATDIVPNRYTRVQYKIMDILKNRQEGQTGMIAFSSVPFIVSPLTQDSETIAELVPTLSPDIMPIDGQNIAAALEKATALIKQSDMRNAEIFLITPGEATANDIHTAELIHKQGIKISVLGFGTPTGAPVPSSDGGFIREEATQQIKISKLDVSGLQSLAKIGGGQYATFTLDSRDIHLLDMEKSHNYFLHSNKTNAKANIWRDDGTWLLLPLLLVAALGFRRGWLDR